MARVIARHVLLGTFICAPFLGVIDDAQGQPTLSDPRIERVIEGELWEARAVDANAIDIDVMHGIATLSGTVDNILSKERAIRIAQMTRGVMSVVDRMTVRESDRSDAAVEVDLQRAFITDPATDSWEIGSTVENGAVTLTGTVQSAPEKRLAERVAKSVTGVRSVDNLISIDHEATRADAELKVEIDERLAWDVRLDDGLLAVEVNDGQVTLDGSVGSDFERNLAPALAWVPGVLGVAVSARKAAACMICPPWQNPHCGTLCSRQAFWAGCMPSLSSPSMVVTFMPTAADTGNWQERTALPSRCTVQAPHRPMPQPYLEPVKPRTSRTYQSIGIDGSPSKECSVPLTVSVIIGPSLP